MEVHIPDFSTQHLREGSKLQTSQGKGRHPITLEMETNVPVNGLHRGKFNPLVRSLL